MDELEEMEKEGLKLKNIRKSFNMTQTEFAKELGVTQSIINMVEKGRRAVSSNIKYGLLQKFGIDWNNPVLTCGSFDKNFSTSEKYKPSVGIPYYSAKVAAGGGFENVGYPDSKVLFFDKRWLENELNLQPEHLSIVKAEGDSMIPNIQDGDLLMVDNSSLNIINNKTFVIYQNGLYRVKKLKKEIDGTIMILSNNPLYPPEIMKEETKIIGQVVWNGSRKDV